MSLIEKGHGKTAVSCEHGSRWMWWFDDWQQKEEWKQVVLACNCNCESPPSPFNSEAEMKKYLQERRQQK